MTTVATSMLGCIRHRRRTLGSSGIISFLCFVRSPLVGRPAPIFIITARSLGVPLSQYIDDLHVGQLFASPMRFVILPSAQRAEAAAYILCYILIEAVYFINTDKSHRVLSTVVCFWFFFMRFYAPGVSYSPG